MSKTKGETGDERFVRRRFDALSDITTTTSSGQILKWIENIPGVELPRPEPAPLISPRDKFVKFELEDPNQERGPAGTVPEFKQESIGVTLGTHQYAETFQNGIECYGGEGVLSVHHPYIREIGGFSLAQIAVVNLGSKLSCKHPTPSEEMQTVEAGWQKWYTRYGDNEPHLFVFYTTNGYSKQGDNQGGYNCDVKGWVQSSDKVYPGAYLTHAELADDQQHVIQIRYQLDNDKWWLWCNGHWVGYYPANLFKRAGPGSQANLTGLDSKADCIAFYGEVAPEKKEDTITMGRNMPLLTREQWNKAAYMRNLSYLAGTKDGMKSYKGKKHRERTDKPFDSVTHFDGGDEWSSYLRYGGQRGWLSVALSRLVQYLKRI